MKTIWTAIVILFSVVFGALNFSLHTVHSDQTALKALDVTENLITNEFVEDGLRKNRAVLRNLPEYKIKNESTHLQLATILSQRGDPNGAIEEYQTALALNPTLSKAYRELGAVYLDKHEWQKAEQSLRKGTTLNQQDHKAWYWLGRSLIAQEHFQQAREALMTAIQLDPTNPQSRSDLGLALMAEGKIQEAGEILKHAIALQPDFAEAHDRLERVQAAQGNSDTLIFSAHEIFHTLFRRQ